MTNIYQTNSKNIAKAVEIIKKGGVIVSPTDTIYGLSANAYDMSAVKRVFEIKGRNFINPMISHISDIGELHKVAQTTPDILKIAKAFWPGALTLVLNRVEQTKELDLVCSGLRTITIRIPDNKVALEILKQAETPLISTSANPAGVQTPQTAEEIYELIGNKVDMILDNGPSRSTTASTILSLTGTKPAILRQGEISMKDIEKVLA